MPANGSLLSGRRPSSPEHVAVLRAVVKARAAHRPGVYRMLAEDGAVVYVGKSKRVRARLLGYFRCELPEKGARILQQTHQIEWEYTPNEFAALLHELRLIKRFRPRFNVTSKRDRRHYGFIRITTGRAPKLTLARSGAGPSGLYYGPFVGRELIAGAVRDLADALGLRDCADDVPMHYSDQPALIQLGPRTPGCIRYEIKKCLGPCVAGCSTREYDERIALARAFLEGTSDGPIERFRREMEEHSAACSYERAALYRDRLRRLERLRDQLGRLRFALESLSFVYTVPGFEGDDRVYLIRRATVRAERAAPKSAPERSDLRRLIEEIFEPGEPSQGTVRLHEIDEVLMLSSWFRRFPGELENTYSAGLW